MKPSISASSISLRPVSGKKQRPSNTIHCSLVRLVKVGAPKEGRHPADGSCMISGSPPAQDFVFRTRSRGYLKAVRRQPCPSPAAAPTPFPQRIPAAVTPVSDGVAVAGESSAQEAAHSAVPQPSNQHLQQTSEGPTDMSSASHASSHASKAQQHRWDCSADAAAAAVPGNAAAAAPAAQQPQSRPAPDRSAVIGELISQDA